MFPKLAYAMIKNGKQSYPSQLISIIVFQNLVWVVIFSKLTYAIIRNWEIKLCISVNIYPRPPKLGMGTHFFQN